jgi:hypothetical protein
MMAQIVQILGALCVLSGFILTQFGLLRSNSLAYQALNFVGGLILTIFALRERQFGFILLEGVWALVALWGIANLLLKRSPAIAR